MDTQVIVVGAGPVGLLLAGELRLGGADVVVVERLARPTTESRASTLHARTMEIFDQRGLLDRLGDAPREPMSHFGGIPLDLGELESPYAGQWKVLQARVEEVLGERARELGAQIWREHELVGLAADGDRVTASMVSPHGWRELTADYLVGCDGENSTVRRLCEIPLSGTGPTRVLLRADVDGIDVPNRRFERLPNGLAIASRRPDGVTRVMMSELDDPAGTLLAQPSFDDVCQAWKRVTGEDISAGRPIWLNAFDDASRQAQRYRDGRVLLAGDAAHVQMPVGGQAINLGLQDAANLGWKLAATVRGAVPDDILDTYHDERHAVGRRVLHNIRTQSTLLLGDATVDPMRQVLRELIGYPAVRDRLAAMIAGLDVRYGDDPQPLVGARMPILDLHSTATAGPVSTAALLRPGRGVLLDLSGDRGRRSSMGREMAGWDDRVDLISASVVPGMPEILLLRPDGHVGWAGDTREDPRAGLRRWFGPPTPDHMSN